MTILPALRRAVPEALPAPVDGLLLAPIGHRGMWPALRTLRTGMAGLRRGGLRPRMTFVIALAEDGHVVPGRHPDARLFILGYTLARH